MKILLLVKLCKYSPPSPRGCLGVDDEVGAGVPDALTVNTMTLIDHDHARGHPDILTSHLRVVVNILPGEPAWLLVIHVVKLIRPLGCNPCKQDVLPMQI